MVPRGDPTATDPNPLTRLRPVRGAIISTRFLTWRLAADQSGGDTWHMRAIRRNDPEASGRGIYCQSLGGNCQPNDWLLMAG
nr:hypothetical protein [Tanacetum cinerariifolium]